MSNPLTIFLLVSVCTFLASADDANDKNGGKTVNKRGLFESKAECDKACAGEHDLNCAPIKGGGPQHACRCASTFYSVQATCEDECENNQFWSLFTYGLCSEYTSTVLPGACNKQCVFKVRVWATVFIIITFTAAVIIILATLPMCIINLIACLRVQKHGKTIEDMHVAGQLGDGTKGTTPSGNPQIHTMNPWQNYPYYNYYGHRA